MLNGWLTTIYDAVYWQCFEVTSTQRDPVLPVQLAPKMDDMMLENDSFMDSTNGKRNNWEHRKLGKDKLTPTVNLVAQALVRSGQGSGGFHIISFSLVDKGWKATSGKQETKYGKFPRIASVGHRTLYCWRSYFSSILTTLMLIPISLTSTNNGIVELPWTVDSRTSQCTRCERGNNQRLLRGYNFLYYVRFSSDRN